MKHNEIVNEMSHLQLNLDKISKLETSIEKEQIFLMYRDLLSEFRMSGNPFDMNMTKIISLFNTLRNNEFLISNREKNIDEIVL